MISSENNNNNKKDIYIYIMQLLSYKLLLYVKKRKTIRINKFNY